MACKVSCIEVQLFLLLFMTAADGGVHCLQGHCCFTKDFDEVDCQQECQYDRNALSALVLPLTWNASGANKACLPQTGTCHH